MSSTADSPSSGQSDATEEQRVQSLDTRFTKIETEQREQRGLLEQIASKIGGGGGAGASGVSQAPSASPSADTSLPGDITSQMRQAVRDVNAEAAAAEHDRQHAAAHDQMSRPAQEQAPREVMVRGKARLQKVFFGADK